MRLGLTFVWSDAEMLCILYKLYTDCIDVGGRSVSLESLFYELHLQVSWLNGGYLLYLCCPSGLEELTLQLRNVLFSFLDVFQ